MVLAVNSSTRELILGKKHEALFLQAYFKNTLSNKYTTYQWQGYFQTYTALSTVQDLQEQFPRRDDFE